MTTADWRRCLRRISIAFSLSILVATVHATHFDQGERQFLDALHMRAISQVRYLDAAGKPLDYTEFAQQLRIARRSYSLTQDAHAGTAVLRLRPPGAHAGEPGRFAFGRGDTFPPFELSGLHGGVRRLGDFHGRYTLVSFFFAECGPCIAEVPTLNAFAREHGDMAFIAITYEDATTARRFVNERGLTWNVLYDGQALIDTLGVGTYPTLMLVDPEGRVAGAAVGMSMQDNADKRLADLNHWVAQWKQAKP